MKSDFLRHSCVVDDNGYFVALVTVIAIKEGDEADEQILYGLSDAERLVNAPYPYGMVQARWIGTTWEETATREEIAAAEAERAAMSPFRT